MKNVHILLLYILCSFLLCGRANADGGATAVVKISSKKNPGDLPYARFYTLQQRLASYLPAEPRHIDMRLRIGFADLSELERDRFEEKSWTVSIVGEDLDYRIPVSRGAYFVLPEIKLDNAADSTIMFNSQTQRNYIEVAWAIRVPESGTLSYRDFSGALAELVAVQRRISWFDRSLAEERKARFDALKACFRDPGARILVDGSAPAEAARGNCLMLKFDPDLVKPNASIVFAGTLESLTLENSEKFLKTVQ